MIRFLLARVTSGVAVLSLCFAIGGWVSAASAQVPSWGIDDFRAPPDPRWASITAKDVEAAYRLIRENHPGAAPELHDAAFKDALEAAHALAIQRARRATSYEGYAATLDGFANALGDKHIWSRPTFLPNMARWPGIILSKRADAWVVADADGDKQKALIGASLVGCDGRHIDDLARENLGGFRAVWRVGAQQIQAAPWLLVDEGNPFIKRPASCIFDQSGQRRTVALDWTRIKRVDLLPRVQKAVGAGEAGYGVRGVGAGYWISIQRLDGHAVAVVKAAQAQQEQLRAAPFVVLDLRGNGGGSSLFGRDIAKVLFEAEQVDARLGSVGDGACDDEVWRASPDNIKDLEYQLQAFGDQYGPEFRKILGQMIDKAHAARAQGKSFSGAVSCPSTPPTGVDVSTQPEGMRGRLIVLTDNACFSSCLSVTDDFRRLGAYHVGQTTDAATHFTEVREQYLPSGYSMFSTLQAVAPASPPEEGPFAPALPYPGDIADTPALEAWVTETAVPKATGVPHRP